MGPGMWPNVILGVPLSYKMLQAIGLMSGSAAELEKMDKEKIPNGMKIFLDFIF
jgi:hypothetical protein